MTRNPVVPQYTSDEDDFDLIDDATEAQQSPPPTSPTQSSTGRLPLSPSTSDNHTSKALLTEATPKDNEPIVPPLPPKPASYAAPIDTISQKMGEASMEDSYVSMGNVSESTDGGYSIYSGGKRAYKALKNQLDWGRDKVVLIAVMGMTGAGKTSFISKATGIPNLKIGHSLESCTREIAVYETKIGDTTVRFVDTPGFSDTYLSDTEVLEKIADYLALAYNKDMKLHGIIYLHPISENRMTGSATKNLKMFKQLTGEKNLKNVVLTTSMWDKVTPEEGAKRERELKEKFWKVLLSFEAKAVKYGGTPESAREVAGVLMENKPFYLQLQEEMGKGNKALKDTSAGKEVMQEIARMKEQHQRELEEMKEMIMKTQEEKNDVAVKALKDYYEELQKNMQKTMMDEKKMNEETVKTLNERISALERNKGGCHIM